MKNHPIPALFLVLALSTTASAQDSVSRAVWTSHMETAVPELLCNDDSYFVACFEMDVAQCQASLGNLTRQCLDRFAADIPDPVRLPDQGSSMGQMVGSCAGSQYDFVNQALKIDTPRCNDPMYWAGQ